jgi:hypothetical protein|tara:strand:+ start:802 stop:984 length:183 start_codon:yes stop_codon:yes gene_type:complete
MNRREKTEWLAEKIHALQGQCQTCRQTELGWAVASDHAELMREDFRRRAEEIMTGLREKA